MPNQEEEAAPGDGSPIEGWVQARRAALQEQAGGDVPAPPAPGEPLWGLAFSGGGIRSATFCLGLASGLAGNRVFRRFDLLSTVSGGGYIGAALGKLFNESGARATTIEAGLGAPGNTWFVWWLRATSRYLTPRGAKDLLWAAATYGRNMLAVHLELALGLMALGAVLGIVNLAAWYGLFKGFGVRPDLIRTAGALFEPWLSTFWFLIVLPLLAAIPLMAAYWAIPSQRSPRWLWYELLLTVVRLAAAAALGLLASVEGDLPLGPVHDGAFQLFCGIAAALFFLTAIAPLLAWLAKPRRQRAADAPSAPLHAKLRRLMHGLLTATMDTGTQAEQRNRLTRWLTGCLLAALGLLLLGAVDRIAWFLAFERTKYGFVLPLVIAFALAMTRALASRLPAQDPATAVSGRLLFKLAELFGILVFGLLAIFWVAVVYRVAMVNLFEQFGGLEFLNAAALVGCFLALPVLLMLLTWRRADFSNLSSLHMFYRARLSRSYLGAANRKRFPLVPADGSPPVDADPLSQVDVRSLADAAERRSVFEVDPGDTVAMARYRPHESGGPVHIMNVTVNQTHDPMGGLFNQDRKGQYLSVTSQGHYRVGLDQWRASEAYSASQLPAWMAISGAAFAPGLGGQTSTGLALLLFMAGVRLGYWWENDTAAEGWRAKLPATKYQLLYGEAFASFGGINDRYWYLSDGGHFENTAAYPLLREGTRLIVLADAAADPRYQYEDLENLVRKARIDLQVEIEFVEVDATGIASLAIFGSLDQLRDPASSACIALARVKYPHAPQGWLVFVKPNIFGGLPIDLINYKRDNPAFPQEPTTDQFFSESQWESYFRLGRELGLQLDGKLLRDIAAEDQALMSRISTASVQPGHAAADSKDGKSLPFSVRYPRAASLAKSGLSLTVLLAMLAAANDTWDRFTDKRAERRTAYANQLLKIAELHEKVATGDRRALPELIAKFGALARDYCQSDSKLRPADRETAGIYQDVAKRCDGRLDDNKQQLRTPVCETLISETVRRCFAGGQRLGQPVYWAVAYDDHDWARDQVVPRPPLLQAAAPPQPPAAVAAPAPAACQGKVIYLQTYDSPTRENIGTWTDWLAGQGASVKEPEDVVASAVLAGLTPPRPVRRPTAVYHTGAELACAASMTAQDSRLVLRQLAPGLVPTQGVVEVWLPPQRSAEQKKY